MNRVATLSLAALLTLGAGASAQSQSQTQSPKPPPSSSGQSAKPPANPPASSSSNDPDDLLNSPMTPPRSDTPAAKPAERPEEKTTNNDFPFPEDEEKGNYSSSKDTQGDLAPPSNDASHPGADVPVELPADPNADVVEMKPWNPHEADKDVEVGTYYFKRENYKAAEARFRDALQWDRNHAEANYRLAEVLNKEGKRQEAAIYYEAYLKILPSGQFAGESRKALSRIDATDDAKKSRGKKAPTSPSS
jgi:tetratricopeptide (TPR) repeat protein